MASVEGIVIDIQGTLISRSNGQAVDGAGAALAYLRKNEIPFLLNSNTSSRPRRVLHARLDDAGILVDERDLLTAPLATSEWLKRRGWTRIMPLFPEAVLEDFEEPFEFWQRGDPVPEAVVLGRPDGKDLWARLSDAINNVIGGAAIVAMHGNRVSYSNNKANPSAGFFLDGFRALPHTGELHVIGKPSPAFFDTCAQMLNVPRERVLVVGDEYEMDARPALKNGMNAMLVQGATERVFPRQSIAALPDLVKALNLRVLGSDRA